MQTDTDTKEQAVEVDRWTLIRDIAVFQVKLVVDGLRDLVLVPVSLVVGIISLLKTGKNRPGLEFYDLLRTGRRSEHWINLFGAAERLHGPAATDDTFAAEDIDKIMLRVESFVVEEYQKGGITTQAKDRFDKALDKLGNLANRKQDTNQTR